MKTLTLAATVVAFLITVAAIAASVFFTVQPLYALLLLVVCATAHGLVLLKEEASKGITDSVNKHLKNLEDRIKILETSQSMSGLGRR